LADDFSLTLWRWFYDLVVKALMRSLSMVVLRVFSDYIFQMALAKD
jgi:hypothetical protein